MAFAQWGKFNSAMASIRQQIDIPLTPDQVWAVLRYPEYMEIWNPKCIKCESLGREMMPGDRFRATFYMSERESVCDGEVMTAEPGKLSVIRYHTVQPKGFVEERIELLPQQGGASTHVRQTLDMSQSGIPKWGLWLISLIHRFGKPVGNDVPLNGLREMALAQAQMK